jgi:phospholipase C
MRRRSAGPPFLAVALYMAIVTPVFAQLREPPQPKTPIHHFVVLMEEGRSFDSYFGAYPGADGIPRDACVQLAPLVNECMKPYTTDDPKVEALSASSRRYTGFFTLAYYTDKQVPYLWNVADQYVLFDRYFSSVNSATNAAHSNRMYWVSGIPGSSTRIPTRGYGNLKTIFDRLEARGISWKFYIQDYEPKVTYRSIVRGKPRPRQVVVAPLLNIARFIDDPNLSKHIVDLREYYSDLAQGTLPAVSYIVTNGARGPSAASLTVGQRHLKAVMQELMRSTAWDSSALLWTHDASGDWYDHVAPPLVDGDRLGMRVPAMLISPYALRGKVDSTPLEHSSILRFIEYNWGLEPLARRDANANNILNSFSFNQPPRPAEFLPMMRATQDTAKPPEPVRFWIFVLYGGGLMVAILISFTLLWAMISFSARKPAGLETATATTEK